MPPKALIPQGNNTRGEADAIANGLLRAMRCVCAVENAGSKNGTGTLIASDLVLTNYHVVDQLIGNDAALEGAECRFGYREINGVVQQGESFRIKEVCIYSEPAPGDEGGEAFDDEHVDFAIIRLDTQVGRLPDPTDGKTRGWIELPDQKLEIDLGTKIVMLQHPYGANDELLPLQYDHDEFEGRRGDRARLLHKVSTRIGSSGSPCFATSDGLGFTFVALHNAAYRTNGERFGQAIPLSRIVANIVRRDDVDKKRYLGVKPPKDTENEEIARQRADAIKRRHTAALCLMDRSNEENEFLVKLSTIGVRPVAEDDMRPLLHVLVCTEKDAHTYFLERLQHLSFGIRLADADQSKIDALKKGLAAPTRSVRPDAWPKSSDGDIRRRRNLANLLALLDVNGRHLLVLSRTIDQGWNAAIEGQLLRDFAGMLVDKFRSNLDGVQAVVSYIVSAGPDTEAKASEFADLWLQESPPHCGVCVRLSEVGRDDLAAWRGYLGTAWGDNDEFGLAINRQFDGAGLKPLDVVASALSDGLAKYISAALDKMDFARER